MLVFGITGAGYALLMISWSSWLRCCGLSNLLVGTKRSLAIILLLLRQIDIIRCSLRHVSCRARGIPAINYIYCDYLWSRTGGFCDVFGDGLSRQQRPLSTISMRNASAHFHLRQARITRDMLRLTHSSLVPYHLGDVCEPEIEILRSSDVNFISMS